MGKLPADDFLLRPKRKCLYSRHTHSPARVAGKKKQGGPNGPPFLLTLSSGEKSALDKTADIARLIEPTLQAMGFELVRVQFGGGQHRPTLQIMAERIDRQPMAVEDCAEISRNLSALLDVEDPVPGSYLLEVSSPGIDRPLVKPADFERFAGFDARLETKAPIEGRKRFRGKLMGVADDRVRLVEEGVELTLPLEQINKAKLLLTDALIGAAAAGPKRN
jgi:ribosome maturation factor RimP